MAKVIDLTDERDKRAPHLVACETCWYCGYSCLTVLPASIAPSCALECGACGHLSAAISSIPGGER